MKGARQLEFFTPKSARQLQEHAKRVEHGGGIRQGKRKLARPFDPRRPLHVTMRSEVARGENSMLRGARPDAIHALVHKIARKNRIKIYQYANSGNHLHILLRARDRKRLRAFLRTTAALVARLMTGAKKGYSTGKFWAALAWSKIVNWGRQFFHGKYYVIQNELEALGLVQYQRRP